MRSSFLYRFTQTCYDLGTALRGMSRLLFAIFCLLFMFALVVGLCSGIWWAVENGLDVKRLRQLVDNPPAGPGADDKDGEKRSGVTDSDGYQPGSGADELGQPKGAIKALIKVRQVDEDELKFEFTNVSVITVPRGTTINFIIYDSMGNAVGVPGGTPVHHIKLAKDLRPNRSCRIEITVDGKPLDIRNRKIVGCESVESRFRDETSQKEFIVELRWVKP
ncbi:MAG: hypothetical protein ACC645_27675 [Pirellulales bacterium]